jgi:hypothetical protein
MNCIIVRTLNKFNHKLQDKSIDVLARYIKIKLHIDISKNALKQKLSLMNYSFH